MPPYLTCTVCYRYNERFDNALFIENINSLNKSKVVSFVNKATRKQNRLEYDIRDDVCLLICWAYVCLVRLTLSAVQILDGCEERGEVGRCPLVNM
jgi:hypothetical protein